MGLYIGCVELHAGWVGIYARYVGAHAMLLGVLPGLTVNSSQVKNKYIFSQSFYSECFSKDGHYAESQHFLWPFNYIQTDSKITIH